MKQDFTTNEKQIIFLRDLMGTKSIILCENQHKKVFIVQSASSPLGAWTTFGPLCHGCSQKNTSQQFSYELVATWPNHRSWDLSVRRSGSTFKVLRTSRLRTLSQTVTQWTYRKNPLSAASTSQTLRFQSLLKIHDDSCGSERKPIWKLAALWRFHDKIDSIKLSYNVVGSL